MTRIEQKYREAAAAWLKGEEENQELIELRGEAEIAFAETGCDREPDSDYDDFEPRWIMSEFRRVLGDDWAAQTRAEIQREIEEEERLLRSLSEISGRLRTQDNRMTQNPMFCLQILVRDSGFDPIYSDNQCWWNPGELACAYDDDDARTRRELGFSEQAPGWEGPYGYKDRWETVMVAFTEGGLERYMELDGHNVKRRAFRGETRIYVESFNRCEEMVDIRNFLLKEES